MMNYNRTTQKTGVCETVYETTAEQSLDADINLPDYCPEIQRILCCNVTPSITSVQNNSGRITAEATACVRILYVNDNEKIAAYEQNYPVQKYIESNKITQECAVDVKIKTDYANCRAVNPRRVDIRAMLSFIFKASTKREENILCSADGAGICTLSDEMSISSVCAISERAFTLSEVVEIKSDKPTVSQLLTVNASAVTDEIKIINNKALIKGSCNVKLYYIAEETGSIESMEHSMPISQIIEADGLNENCDVTVRMNISSCSGVMKSDSSGNMRLIELNVRISAFTLGFEEIPATFINDAYSTEYDSENVYKNTEIMIYNDKIDTSFTNKVILESIGVSVKGINAVWCSDISCIFTPKDERCIISGTYMTNIIYKDAENRTEIIRKPVDFEFPVRMNEKTDRIDCCGTVMITSVGCAVTGDSRLELKTELYASGVIFSKKMKKYVSDIHLSEDNIKKDSCALTIYFCEKNESLWDIAKRYNTTPEAIKSENGIEDLQTQNKGMLLIPANC